MKVLKGDMSGLKNSALVLQTMGPMLIAGMLALLVHTFLR
jgi:hypothetical protein